MLLLRRQDERLRARGLPEPRQFPKLRKKVRLGRGRKGLRRESRAMQLPEGLSSRTELREALKEEEAGDSKGSRTA